MTDPENFLARWSRRKRDPSSQAGNAPRPESAGERPPAAPAPDAIEPVVDPADLPPIDTIGPGSDIRPFLVDGVPAELKLAVLRRAWSSDPVIRDFVGLSENSWDFNAAGAMPGFGAIDEETVRQLVDRVIGETEATTAQRSVAPDVTPDAAAKRAGGPEGAMESDTAPRFETETDAQTRRPQDGVGNSAGDDDALAVTPQHKPPQDGECPQRRRPRHGGALPK